MAGSLARRELSFYEIDGLRPTSARIRETLFNWLTPAVTHANCLDLFAGSGALGFEAISRGAAKVTFVEKHRQMAALIKDNLSKFSVTNASVIHSDYQQFLTQLAKTAAKPPFDIVFLDPPYRLRLLPTLLPQIARLNPSFIYIEDEQVISDELLGLWGVTDYQVHRQKKAGQVSYALLKHKPSATM